jgi:hypothetical protein
LIGFNIPPERMNLNDLEGWILARIDSCGCPFSEVELDAGGTVLLLKVEDGIYDVEATKDYIKLQFGEPDDLEVS